jgi:pyruvate dehydrogenase E2 component (dihydrolipoamide acetyltransferase)
MADQTFRLPDLGEGLTEAQLVAWRVEEGAAVEVNAPLCEVETAKAVVVIPSPWAGTIQKLHARPGESVAVGEALVTIAAAEATQAEATPGTLVGYGPGAPESGIRRKARTASPVPESSGDVRAAPFVRQLAKEMGVDVAQLTGSGPGGRITRADVEAAASSPAAAPSSSTAAPPTDGERRISVVGIRKAIARQMVRSVSTIPQFTEFAVFDATNLMAAREQRKVSGRSMTPLPYFIAAVVKAVRAYPLMNSSWDESRDEIIVKQAINVGIAVNTSQGLLVPVLRGADQLELTAIAEKSAQLIGDAATRPDERRHDYRHQRRRQRPRRDRYPDHQSA